MSEKFKYKRMSGIDYACYGEYLCDVCGHIWSSNTAWRHYGQKCLPCHTSRTIQPDPESLQPNYYYICTTCENIHKTKYNEEEKCRMCGVVLPPHTFYEFKQAMIGLGPMFGQKDEDREGGHRRELCQKCRRFGVHCTKVPYKDLEESMSMPMSTSPPATQRGEEAMTLQQHREERRPPSMLIVSEDKSLCHDNDEAVPVPQDCEVGVQLPQPQRHEDAVLMPQRLDQKIQYKDQETHPLLNPLVSLILLKVFHYLAHSSLKNARLVCHVWNDEAASIVTKRSQIILKSPNELHRDNSYPDDCDLDDSYFRENHFHDHDKLKDTLVHSSNPAIFFQNAVLDFALLQNWRFLQLLQKFGHFLNSVEVRSCNFQEYFDEYARYGERIWKRGTDSNDLRTFLYPMLTKYCKNLVHLKVQAECNCYADEDEYEISQSRSSLKITEPLALECVDVIGWEFRIMPSPLPPELSFLLDVIKASPKLKRLNFTAASRFVQSLDFCEGISTLESSKNFEEFGWRFALDFDYDRDDDKRGNIMEMFQIISKMKMKELRILSLSNLTLYNADMMAELVEFFKRNGKNLKTLILRDVCINLDGRKENAEPVFSTSKFEEILRLCPAINSISIKPAKHRADLIMDFRPMELKPYPNLTKLVLGGYTLKNIESFQAVVGWFPNLLYLNLDGIRLPFYSQAVGEDDDDTFGIPPRAFQGARAIAEVDIVEVVRALGSLQKLQEFVLRVDFSFKQKVNLVEIIEAAHYSPVLKIVTIIDGGDAWKGGYYEMDDLKDALMQTKGFNCVQFANFLMKEDEKLNISTFICENHLPAKFVVVLDDATFESDDHYGYVLQNVHSDFPYEF